MMSGNPYGGNEPFGYPDHGQYGGGGGGGPGPYGSFGGGGGGGGYGQPPPFGGGGGGGGGGGRRRGRRDEGPPGVSLLVRNVSPEITTQDLEQAFSRIGSVRDVYIPRDFHSQQPKGFAFVEYASNEQAREARNEMDKFVIKGRELEVVFAQEKRKTPNQMRDRVVDGGPGVPGHGMGVRRGGGGGPGVGGAGMGGAGDFER